MWHDNSSFQKSIYLSVSDYLTMYLTGLELVIFLPQPDEYWDSRHAPPCPAKKSLSVTSSLKGLER
jgi:hypothetical protein